MIRLLHIVAGMAVLLWTGLPAAAQNLSVTFIESTPVDLLIVENEGDCDLYDFTMQIDLSTSAGGLLFDVSQGGAGASAYQPFAVLDGHEAVRSFARVEDGDRSATIQFRYLEARRKVTFMIDLDNSLQESAFGQTIIDTPEIAGATVSVVSAGDAPHIRLFGADGRAEARISGCGPVS